MAGFKQAFKSALTDVDTTAQEDLGTVRYDLNGVHKYVKFSGTTTIAAGDVLCYVASDTTNQTVDGANTSLGAGVANAAVASGTVQYGWVRVKGVATLSTAFAGSPAVGDDMTTASAVAPAVTKKVTDNAQSCGNVVNVSGKIFACNFPI